MTPPLIACAGLTRTGGLTLDRLLDVAVVDADGRVLVALVDVLAAVRLDRCAEILVAGFAGGGQLALAVRDVVSADDVWLQIDPTDEHAVVVRLTAPGRTTPTDALVTLTAMTFQRFVGDC
jgi:hypothetical protein